MPISFQADLLGERYKEYSYKAFKCRPFCRCQIVISFFTNDWAMKIGHFSMFGNRKMHL